MLDLSRLPNPPSAAIPREPRTAPHSFVLGANLPWIRYGGDFGVNAWHPDGGVAAGSGPARLDETIERLASSGVSAIRWFMLCDGRAGIRFDADGTPLGLDDHVFTDIDAAVRLVAARGVSILFTLIDFTWCRPRDIVNGVQIGGRAGVLANPDQREALLGRVFTPILQRFGDEAAIMGWDIINEPEWATFGQGSWDPRASVSRTDMREFIRGAADAIHRATNQPATVGLARGSSLELVEALGLDFYQVHWYDHLEGLESLRDHGRRLVDVRPMLLGEFPTRGTRRTLDGILTVAQEAGYSGAFFWSALADDSASDGSAAGADLAAWVRAADRAGGERPSLR